MKRTKMRNWSLGEEPLPMLEETVLPSCIEQVLTEKTKDCSEIEAELVFNVVTVSIE